MRKVEATHLKIGAEICQGTFGHIKKATLTNEDGKRCEVLVMQISLSKVSPEKFTSWSTSHQSLENENVLKFIGVCYYNNNRAVIMESTSFGLLNNFVQMNRKWLKDDMRLMTDLVAQLSSALKHIVDLGQVHGDIGARNVLVTRDSNKFVPKLFNVSLSKFAAKSSRIIDNDDIIPFRWSAPEVISDQEYSAASDTWAFGVLMWEVFEFGAIPYGIHFPNNYIQDQIKSGYRLERPKHCPVDVYTLMSDCWHDDKSSRIAISQLNLKLSQLVSSLSAKASS
ncbi:Megakaryocyte-associated tyrosine-protein kinase [Halotydeus destructor]|nr:Megakaryocyte-associated tyrosine-protein kinase [Halotydeus destructor]